MEITQNEFRAKITRIMNIVGGEWRQWSGEDTGNRYSWNSCEVMVKGIRFVMVQRDSVIRVFPKSPDNMTRYNLRDFNASPVAQFGITTKDTHGAKQFSEAFMLECVEWYNSVFAKIDQLEAAKDALSNTQAALKAMGMTGHNCSLGGKVGNHYVSIQLRENGTIDRLTVDSLQLNDLRQLFANLK